MFLKLRLYVKSRFVKLRLYYCTWTLFHSSANFISANSNPVLCTCESSPMQCKPGPMYAMHTKSNAMQTPPYAMQTQCYAMQTKSNAMQTKSYAMRIQSHANANPVLCYANSVQCNANQILWKTSPMQMQTKSYAIFRNEFASLIHFEAFSSQDFVHRVLPHDVLDNDQIGEVSRRIRQVEEDFDHDRASNHHQSGLTFIRKQKRFGLNQARELLYEEVFYGGGKCTTDSFLRSGFIHKKSPEQNLIRRAGYYQLSRFSPEHELALVWKWPREYTIRFRYM